MAQDEDLKVLHGNAKFDKIVAKARENYEQSFKKYPIEEGRDIAGVKTVEGAPKGGLHYRLRMFPDATKEHTQFE